MSTITILADTQAWSLSEAVLGSNKHIKIPVAIKGEWKHPEYGQVEFNQQDFNDIIRNWREARAGYDPPLFIGHPVNTGEMDAAPSAGWPNAIYQDGDVLYGVYSPTTDQIYEDVLSQKYRYSSAEVIRNARDKETGEKIGTLLVGIALTNRPFLPLRDYTVEAVEQKFSDYVSPTLFCFDYDSKREKPSMPDNTNVSSPAEAKTETVTPQTFSAPSNDAPTAPAVGEMVPKADYDALAEEFSQLAKEFSAMKQQFSEIVTKERGRAINEKLNKLNALNLPASTKQTFSDMITSGSLTPEAEEKLFSDYQQLSDTYKDVFTTPQGSQESAPASKEVELPQYYADIIARNNEVAKSKQSAYQPQVFSS